MLISGTGRQHKDCTYFSCHSSVLWDKTTTWSIVSTNASEDFRLNHKPVFLFSVEFLQRCIFHCLKLGNSRHNSCRKYICALKRPLSLLSSILLIHNLLFFEPQSPFPPRIYCSSDSLSILCDNIFPFLFFPLIFFRGFYILLILTSF